MPSGKPEPKVAVTPTTFAINVLNVRNSFNATPLNIVFISGIPEPIQIKMSIIVVTHLNYSELWITNLNDVVIPIDCGATKCTNPAANVIKLTGNNTQEIYCKY